MRPKRKHSLPKITKNSAKCIYIFTKKNNDVFADINLDLFQRRCCSHTSYNMRP